MLCIHHGPLCKSGWCRANVWNMAATASQYVPRVSSYSNSSRFYSATPSYNATPSFASRKVSQIRSGESSGLNSSETSSKFHKTSHLAPEVESEAPREVLSPTRIKSKSVSDILLQQAPKASEDQEHSQQAYIAVAFLIIGLIAPFFMHPAIGATSAAIGIFLFFV